VGDIASYGFDLRTCLFTLKLISDSTCSDDRATEIFLPEYHFPSDRTTVEVSGGKWSISFDEDDGGLIQKLCWWHADGEQSIKVKGVQRPLGLAAGNDEEGYFDQCQQNNCALM
jgi:hypothetical protein